MIEGYASAILDGKVPADELPRYLEAIADKAESLTALINTFYEYSKTEHPDFRLSCRDVDLGEFLREYLAEKYEEIDLAGFTLDVRIPETPVWCRLDSFQFRRAMDNILSNSLRYNTLGTMIRVSLTADGLCARLRVADNGIGIPPSIRERLFEPFTTRALAAAAALALPSPAGSWKRTRARSVCCRRPRMDAVRRLRSCCRA